MYFAIPKLYSCMLKQHALLFTEHILHLHVLLVCQIFYTFACITSNNCRLGYYK